jgi:hypothetical protein
LCAQFAANPALPITGKNTGKIGKNATGALAHFKASPVLLPFEAYHASKW